MGNTNSAASSADASNRPSGLGSPARGRKKQGGKYSQCTYVLYLAKIELFYTYDAVIFFIAFLSSPYRKTPQNALKNR